MTDYHYLVKDYLTGEHKWIDNLHYYCSQRNLIYKKMIDTYLRHICPTDERHNKTHCGLKIVDIKSRITVNG